MVPAGHSIITHTKQITMIVLLLKRGSTYSTVNSVRPQKCAMAKYVLVQPLALSLPDKKHRLLVSNTSTIKKLTLPGNTLGTQGQKNQIRRPMWKQVRNLYVRFFFLAYCRLFSSSVTHFIIR